MALSEIDRSLLDRCLHRKPRAWEDFVDRFMGLVVHVINHTAQCRSINLSAADREDLAAEVFLAIVDNDMAVLRHFRGRSSLATYLTVIARRVVVRKLVEGRSNVALGDMVAQAESDEVEPEQPESATSLMKSADCSVNCKGRKPPWCGCITWKGKPIKRSADRSACRRTVSDRCSAGPGRNFDAEPASMGL